MHAHVVNNLSQNLRSNTLKFDETWENGMSIMNQSKKNYRIL